MPLALPQHTCYEREKRDPFKDVLELNFSSSKAVMSGKRTEPLCECNSDCEIT